MRTFASFVEKSASMILGFGHDVEEIFALL
jgi:hypothetical protein